MNYNQTLEFLFSSLVSYQEKGPEAYKPGLERITAFCKHLGNPQRNYFTIHVAGTNGKGSVSHMLASVLQQAGYRTGLYTSPHLRDFRERILVDGEMIPKQKVVNFVDKHYDCMKELGLSFFEMSTALAFDYFDQSDVEVAVIETGLGGRLDATNLIIPIVSVITNIGLDHMALLGDTLPKIAAEKAGIIKKSIPVVIGEKSDEYNHVFDQAATAMMSKIVYAENDFACINHSTEGDFQKFSILRHRDNKVFNLELDLTGNYQVHNILTAIAVIDLLHQETPLTISLRALTEGMRTVASGTALQGRWQKLGDKPLTICDTGHNAHGIRYVAEQLAATPHRDLYCVLGFVNDKDLSSVLPLFPKEARYIFTQHPAPPRQQSFQPGTGPYGQLPGTQHTDGNRRHRPAAPGNPADDQPARAHGRHAHRRFGHGPARPVAEARRQTSHDLRYGTQRPRHPLRCGTVGRNPPPRPLLRTGIRQ